MDIGKRIKDARKQAGFTQVQLAKSINKKETTIRKYENGTIIPPLPVLQDIARVLDVPIDHFLEIKTFDNWDDWKTFSENEEAVKKLLRENENGIRLEKTDDGRVIVSDAVLSDIKIKNEIADTLDSFTSKGLTEAQHQIELLSRIPDFKKES